ncbi:MAG TPA: SPOR domain-containing protein [Desulfitobacterium dehalogenans]|uniref:SPOR domain-containing protein n=1 Tax=Desulfitobacterium dehalogenans TaxID=36854 RepID=A0A7C6Z5G5_9FIRM|nr:SPOR domain-containing protein [Desulfitobacterium dehalogenans]
MYKYNPWINKGIGLIGCAVIVWMTWFFGYTYVKLVTQPKGSDIPSPSPADQNEFFLTLDTIEFWTCQTGVFNSESNALKEKEQLQQLGWDAQIISRDPFIVGVGFAYSKEEVLPIQELLKEGGVVSIPKSVTSPERAFRIHGTGAIQTAKVLEGVNTFLKTPYTARESRLSEFENLMVSTPRALTNLYEVSRLSIKAERTLPVDQRKMMSLNLYGEYLNTLEILQK